MKICPFFAFNLLWPFRKGYPEARAQNAKYPHRNFFLDPPSLDTVHQRGGGIIKSTNQPDLLIAVHASENSLRHLVLDDARLCQMGMGRAESGWSGLCHIAPGLTAMCCEPGRCYGACVVRGVARALFDHRLGAAGFATATAVSGGVATRGD